MNALAPIVAAAPSAVADRAALLRAVEIATNVVETRNTYPILSNLRLRGDGRTMFVTGTDLDIMVDVAVPAAADAAFDVTIPALMLKNLLKGAPKAADMVAFTAPAVVTKTKWDGKYETDPVNGNFVFDAEGGKVKIMTEFEEYDGPVTLDFDVAKYTLNGLMPDNFPDLEGPGELGRFSFQIPGADLFASLDAVAFAISNEETRYYLNGIYLHNATPYGGAGYLRAVATDGHRMARHDVAAPDGCKGMPGVILQKNTVALLLRLLKPAKGKALPIVDVELTESKVRFQFDGITVTAKFIEGTFPDYERVTPQHNDKLATFSVEAMLEAMKAVTIMASDRGGKAVKLAIAEGICTMSVSNPDHGTAESPFPVSVSDGFGGYFEIGFNARYLADLVSEAKADGDAVTLAFNDAGSPTVVTGSREGWLGVLMPMRI